MISSATRLGDQVLAQLGSIFKSQLRSYALAARYGGDEFVLLLPGTSKEEAIVIAGTHSREDWGLGSTRLSPAGRRQYGRCHSFVADETGEELVARADEALYRARKKAEAGSKLHDCILLPAALEE